MTGRRNFLGSGMAILASAGLATARQGDFNDSSPGRVALEACKPFSERKVRVGIAGEGVCCFGSAFGYQNHPNVEVVACTDLDPARCRLLQQRTGAKRTYASCEELIRHAAEDKVEALYIATDAPSHAPLAILALEHGLHVCSAVPALLGKEQLDLVPRLLAAVKSSGKVYQMNETTAFRESCHTMRKLYEAGEMGAIVYCEGEYFHCANLRDGLGVGSYKGWRDCLPPLYYATHATGYYIFTTHRRLTEVSCIARPSVLPCYSRPNRYGNRFGSEFALFKTEEGGAARMLVAYDVLSRNGERGRIWGTKGSYDDASMAFLGDPLALERVAWRKPQLPPGMPAGDHGGSHGYLTDDFIRAILLKNHTPCCDVVSSLNATIAGIYAHLSAEKGGETLPIPAVG
ncbi:MAG: Gfo/Idh/MocA family oxidoreductase [Kiritimatiellia bacterium]|nr:Gfo/Idh/MocA family oxidoreductase [Kiritimatiellia bacterium]